MNDILQDILKERAAQDAKWGGPDHDDQHDPEEWLDLIEEQVDHANVLIGSSTDEEYRKRLAKIAALAVAAIESLDQYHVRDK